MQSIKSEAEKNILSGDSGVKISLVIALLTLCAGGFAVWIWWAATVSAKLDNIILQQAAQVAQQTKVMSDVEELKAWRKLVDTMGSPTAQNMNDRLKELEKKIEIHEKLSTRP